MNLEILQKFCSKHSWKTFMEKPFVFQGKTYATDGYLLVRVEEELEGVSPYSEFPFEAIQENFNKPLREPLNLKQFESEEIREQCNHCGGTGKVTTCPECEGSGEIELDSGYNFYSVECQTCGGTGEYSDPEGDETCENCDGEGTVSVRKLVTIGVSNFDNRLLNKLIQNLPPDTEIAPAHEPMRAAVLRWTGGEGLIMPYRA